MLAQILSFKDLRMCGRIKKTDYVTCKVQTKMDINVKKSMYS